DRSHARAGARSRAAVVGAGSGRAARRRGRGDHISVDAGRGRHQRRRAARVRRRAGGSMTTAKRRRAVVIGGVRTPFVKAFAEFMRLDTIALGAAAVRGLLDRFPIPRREIGALIWGGVILPAYAPNVGREI